jgi:hypothetical protein
VVQRTFFHDRRRRHESCLSRTYVCIVPTLHHEPSLLIGQHRSELRSHVRVSIPVFSLPVFTLPAATDSHNNNNNNYHICCESAVGVAVENFLFTPWSSCLLHGLVGLLKGGFPTCRGSHPSKAQPVYHQNLMILLTDQKSLLYALFVVVQCVVVQ